MSEFLAMLAHELRNPLAPMRNAVSVMQMQHDLSPQVMQMRDVIARQIGHLTRLVDDLLEVARIVTGKILLKREPIDFRDVVMASVEAARPAVEAAAAHLVVKLPPEAVPVRGTRPALPRCCRTCSPMRPVHRRRRRLVADRAHGGQRVLTTGDRQRHGHRAPRPVAHLRPLRAGAFTALQQDSGLGIGLTLARSSSSSTAAA